ncbi:MAG: KamA family radical SAM protein [Myxococcales bacterium]|nr:KamA family radical SAM protein [Myxococcales bacterium]
MDLRDPQWLDWHWQLRHRLRTAADLDAWFTLTPEQRGWIDGGGAFETGITPYFASLCRRFDPACPLARQVIPDSAEQRIASFERADPLGEDPHRRAPGVVHKYPDRVLLLVTDTCASYCRYCTRSRWVAAAPEPMGSTDLAAALDYIARTPGIRDVLVSGGDPLLLSTPRLAALLDRLAAIPHLRFVRIGTRVPVFLPMRVDADLCAALRPRRIPVFVNVHLNHPRELAAGVRDALGQLADAGVPLGGQAVLLRGINDDADTLRELFYGMLEARVRPYYLFHCDPVRGTSHLRTSVEDGLRLMGELVGRTSGMAVPKYCIDLEGGGKVPLWPSWLESIDQEAVTVTNWRGERWRYVNHPGKLENP